MGGEVFAFASTFFCFLEPSDVAVSRDHNLESWTALDQRPTSRRPRRRRRTAGAADSAAVRRGPDIAKMTRK